ncbi:MAG: hypothetical protein MJZ25_08310 [Fibrobacter sp.]|nr:hypothetical protein [Fibrobacter sp.]
MSAQFGKYAVVASAVILGLSACGDESTVSDGGSNVSIFDEKLGECSESNQGAMAYVTDSAALYFCADGEWVPLKGQDGEDGKDGKDGENGKDGKDGKKGDKGDKGDNGDNGDNGTSCTAEIINEGIEVSCDGEVLDTLRNGKSAFELAESELSLEDWLASLKGDKGDKGDNGTSCSISDKGNGVVKLICGDNYVTLKEPLCGSTPYDPEKWICFGDGELIQNTASSTATSSAAAPITSSASYSSEAAPSSSASYSSEAAPSSSASVPSSSAAPCEETVKGTYTDTRDDHEYKTVTIGDRTWFAENIQYPASSVNTKVHTNGGQRLYYGANGVCPEGWRLPSKADFEDLIARATCGGTGDPSEVLRSTTWDGTDELGFSVVPTGNCGSSDCWNPDKYTAFWTADLLSLIGSTSTYSTLAFDYADDDPNKGKMSFTETKTAYAISIRCVKDKE